MAQPVCNFCDNEYGLLMDTNLMEGDTKVVGANCLIGYALSMAVAVTAGMSPDTAVAYGDLFDQIAANGTRPERVTPQNAPGKRRKPGASESSEATQPAEALSNAAMADLDAAGNGTAD